MRRFFFDLSIGNVVMLDLGGIVHEHLEATMATADRMARHLFIWRMDLRDRDAWVRVRDEQGREIYRSAVWSDSAERVGWDD